MSNVGWLSLAQTPPITRKISTKKGTIASHLTDMHPGAWGKNENGRDVSFEYERASQLKRFGPKRTNQRIRTTLDDAQLSRDISLP